MALAVAGVMVMLVESSVSECPLIMAVHRDGMQHVRCATPSMMSSQLWLCTALEIP